MKLSEVFPGMTVVFADDTYTNLGGARNPLTGRRFELGDVAKVVSARQYGREDGLVCLHGVSGEWDVRAFRPSRRHQFPDLRLKDVAPGVYLTIKTLDCTALGSYVNPFTRKNFRVGDVVKVARVRNEGPVDLVKLYGLDVNYEFDLRAFRCTTLDEANRHLLSLYGAPGPVLPESRDQKPRANCDQESTVRSRIVTAIRMGIAAFKESKVGADAPALNSAIEGIANGAAVEVVRSLGMEPSYVNLRRTPLNGDVNCSTPMPSRYEKEWAAVKSAAKKSIADAVLKTNPCADISLAVGLDPLSSAPRGGRFAWITGKLVDEVARKLMEEADRAAVHGERCECCGLTSRPRSWQSGFQGKKVWVCDDSSACVVDAFCTGKL